MGKDELGPSESRLEREMEKAFQYASREQLVSLAGIPSFSEKIRLAALQHARNSLLRESGKWQATDCFAFADQVFELLVSLYHGGHFAKTPFWKEILRFYLFDAGTLLAPSMVNGYDLSLEYQVFTAVVQFKWEPQHASGEVLKNFAGYVTGGYLQRVAAAGCVNSYEHMHNELMSFLSACLINSFSPETSQTTPGPPYMCAGPQERSTYTRSGWTVLERTVRILSRLELPLKTQTANHARVVKRLTDILEHIRSEKISPLWLEEDFQLFP